MNARRAALTLLDGVLREKRMLSHLKLPVSGPDAARGNRLATAVLRNLAAADHVLEPFAMRKPQIAVQNILRLGVIELFLHGEDPHGVTHELVEIAKETPRTARAAGMVNAVMRKVMEAGPEPFAAAPPSRLPPWIDKALRKRIGAGGIRALEEAHTKAPPLDITLKDQSLELPGAHVLPTGSVRFREQVQVTALPGYSDGAFWVQDAAAALPVNLLGELLGELRGKKVLDLCAAPGGKTMQLAAAGAEVTALDISQARMKTVEENLARTQLSARMVIADAFEFGETFDAILLDAPCSATGTMRRHPDLRFVKSGREIEPLTKLQMRMLDHAITLLNPGGTLVYCTCSLLPVEGEFQVKAALGRHSGLRVLPVDPKSLGGESEWASPEGGLRLHPGLWPDLGGMDGFYIAALTCD